VPECSLYVLSPEPKGVLCVDIERVAAGVLMRVEVNGIRLFFEVGGRHLDYKAGEATEQPTLIVLHGAPGFSDHTAFRPDFALLEDVCRVVYLDMRGCGRSDDDPNGQYSLEGWADDLVGFCDALEIHKPAVLGNSAGGMVAAVYGIRHPDHPGKLILSSTQARLDPQRCAVVFERLGGAVAREAALDSLERIGDLSTFAAYGERCMPLYNPTPQGVAFQAAVFRKEVAVAFHTLGGVWHTMDHLDDLRHVVCPTLVTAGAQDPVTPIEDSEDIVAHLDPSIVQFERFENAGHGVWHDDPGRAFALLREFIAPDTSR